jgi:hypothetical protein
MSKQRQPDGRDNRVPPHAPGSAIAATRWHSFFRGWQDACACKPRRPEYTDNADADMRESYEHGFSAGVCDRRKTASWATLQFGYSPTILREASSPNK